MTEERDMASRELSPSAGDGDGSLPVPPADRHFTFRLTDNMDPEERLEEAALWKAMHDVYGTHVRSFSANDRARADYGRPRRYTPGEPSPDLAYWNDPAFLKHSGRRFWCGPWDEAKAQVDRLHADGLGAFVKSTRAKHWIDRIPVGVSLEDAAEDMAYTFIDGGPPLMVQELADVRYEHRFFVVGRRVVASSPNAGHLTPIDYPMPFDFDTPASPRHSGFSARPFLQEVAAEIAREMVSPDAVIDCALINGKPACVEINPLIVGGVGLFACNVRALAAAIYDRDTLGLIAEKSGNCATTKTLTSASCEGHGTEQSQTADDAPGTNPTPSPESAD